jgi:hypothetical protein
MKLLLDGKPRNIYFRKDNTAYYKNNGIENNITHYFKKTGGLKKQYSNLLVENNKTITVQPLKNRKIILGGAGPTFSKIDISIPKGEFEPIDKVIFMKGLLQLVILCKIECDNNDGDIKFLTDDINTGNKNNFIILLEIIFGCYINNTTNSISTNNIKIRSHNEENVLCAIGSSSDSNSSIIKLIKKYIDGKNPTELKKHINELFVDITYEKLGKQIDIAQKQITDYNKINTDADKKAFTEKPEFTNIIKYMSLMTDLIKEIKDDNAGIKFEEYFT